MARRHRESVFHFFQSHRRGRRDVLRFDSDAIELSRGRHRKAARVRRSNQFLRISSSFLFESFRERISHIRQHTTVGRNRALAVFQTALPGRRSFTFHRVLLRLRSIPIAYIFLSIMKTHLATVLCLFLTFSACASARTSGNDTGVATGADAKKFMDDVNETLLKLGVEGSQAGWVSENYITDIMRESRDEKKLRVAWEGWHTISPPMRKDYVRFVDLSNKGAKELGFADTGAMWRAKYDMPPDEFTKELDRLWGQVRPLY